MSSDNAADASDAADETTSVHISKRLLAKLRFVRVHHRLRPAEALERFAGPAIEAEYARIVRELADEMAPAEAR